MQSNKTIIGPAGAIMATLMTCHPGNDGDGKTDPAVYDPGLSAYCAWLSGSEYVPAMLGW